MCFSATASFGISGALIGAGVVSLRFSTKKERILAIIPFLFGIQQAIEGVQWLVPHPSTQSLVLGYFYIFFAFLLWPTLIPLAVYLVETVHTRKRLLYWIAIFGACITSMIFISLLVTPLLITLPNGHFVYTLEVSPWVIAITKLLYSLAVIGSLFASRKYTVKYLGAAVLIAELVTLAFFPNSFVSTWCFLAAVSSAGLVVYFYTTAKNKKLSKT